MTTGVFGPGSKNTDRRSNYVPCRCKSTQRGNILTQVIIRGALQICYLGLVPISKVNCFPWRLMIPSEYLWDQWCFLHEETITATLICSDLKILNMHCKEDFHYLSWLSRTSRSSKVFDVTLLGPVNFYVLHFLLQHCAYGTSATAYSCWL